MKEGYPAITLNSIRTNRSLSTMLVVAMLLGWMALSQRCALGQLLLKAQQAAAVQHDCCEKSNPKPADGGRGAECCQALSVLVPEGAKLPDTASADYVPVPREWVLAALESLAAGRSFTPDTGPPPDVPGFVELVLHRSLRSQAPPVLA